jgi:hypothetical protein
MQFYSGVTHQNYEIKMTFSGTSDQTRWLYYLGRTWFTACSMKPATMSGFEYGPMSINKLGMLLVLKATHGELTDRKRRYSVT